MTLKTESVCEHEKGVFGLEITTTDACNFKCSYCFERDHKPSNNLDWDVLKERIWDLLDSVWFNKTYSGVKIILWGGEPTLNLPLCRKIIHEFAGDQRVCFFLYTNGSTIDQFIPLINYANRFDFIKKDIKKFTVQVSYDGNPINDFRRKTNSGELCSDIVHRAIYLLDENDIDFGLKATMSWEDFYLMPQSWDDFYEISRVYDNRRIQYSVTVDYHNVEFYKYKIQIEKALIEVAKRELKFYKKFETFLSNIFRTNRAFCATGKNMAVIDAKGDVFFCHGCIYSKDKKDFMYTSIYDKENFINNIESMYWLFYDNHIEPEECQNCISTMCLRCNVRKYEESNKDKLLDRWFDYTTQEELCEYYKLVGKIGTALLQLIRGN